MESIVDEGPLAVQRCIDLGLDVSYCFTLRFYAIDSGKRAYYRVGDGSSWIECPSRSPLPADPSRTTAQREHTGACTLFWVRDSTDRLDPQTTGRKDPDDDLGSLRGPLWRWRETSHAWCLDSRGVLTTAIPNFCLKWPRICPKSMWKKSPFVLIITLSLWRSPIPNTYVATQYLRWRSIQESYAAQLLAKRSVAVASGSEIGGSTSIPWSLPRQSNRNMHTRLIPLYLFLQTLPPTSWCMYHSSALPLQPLFSSLEISLRINYSSNEYELILICFSYDFQHSFYICAQ